MPAKYQPQPARGATHLLPLPVGPKLLGKEHIAKLAVPEVIQRDQR